MRLTGPVFPKTQTPEAWVAAHKKAGFSIAAAPPFAPSHDLTSDQQAYLDAARGAGLAFAEVGAWSNPISPSAAEARRAIEKCIAALALADEIGARCCVNIAGARGKQWDGPHPDNLTRDTFDLIVSTVRRIIDAVKPRRTFYALETMPWSFPDSPDNYRRLLRAIDRRHFGVHLDPVNMINCPDRAFRTSEFIRECFAKLGPYIRSCHAKDISLSGKLTVHLDECRPGLGVLDYAAYLRELSKLDPETPLVLEHLPAETEYRAAATHIRKIAKQEGLELI